MTAVAIATSGGTGRLMLLTDASFASSVLSETAYRRPHDSGPSHDGNHLAGLAGATRRTRRAKLRSGNHRAIDIAWPGIRGPGSDSRSDAEQAETQAVPPK